MMDAKARLVEAVNGLTVATFRAIEDAGNDSFAAPEVIACRQRDILRRALATALPPELPGPVVSHEAINALARLHGYTGCDNASHYRLCPSCQATAREVQDGLLTPAEVERALSSFDWSYDKHPNPDEIMAALTRGAK